MSTSCLVKKLGDTRRTTARNTPLNTQERYDNLFYYYAKWGKPFVNKLEEHSLVFEQQFAVLSMTD